MAAHTPAGKCRKCGYPMDPGRCPECGTFCMDVSPIPRVSGSRLLLAVAIALMPIVAAVVMYSTSTLVYHQFRAGTAAGTSFERAWERAERLGAPLYFFIVPLLVMSLAALLARAERRRQGAWSGAVTILVIASVLGAVSWVAGAYGLLVTLLRH